jgi:hypothetical protein
LKLRNLFCSLKARIAGREERGSLIRVRSGISAASKSLLRFNNMKILRAIGLGLTIIMLKFLVPKIFTGFENMLLTFFDTLTLVLGQTQNAMNAASIMSLPK